MSGYSEHRSATCLHKPTTHTNPPPTQTQIFKKMLRN